MCARFPSLRELELHYIKSLTPDIFDALICEEENELSFYLKQIKTLSAKPSIEINKYDRIIKIYKSNKRIWIWTGSNYLLCKAKHVSVTWFKENWTLVENPLDENQYFLLIKNNWVNFCFEQLELDNDLWEYDKEFYADLYKSHYKCNNPFYLENSILFIIMIEFVPISDQFSYTPLIMNITLNDSSKLYNLTWSQHDINLKLEKMIDSFDDQTKIEVKVVPSVVNMNGFYTRMYPMRTK